MVASFDLATVRRELHGYLGSLQVAGRPYGCFRAGPGNEPDFYTSADAAILWTVMGENFGRLLSAEQRKQWIDYLREQQDPADGSFPECLQHSKQHGNGTAIGALGALGGRMKYPVHLYEAFDTPQKVVPWLETKIDWARQWGASHLFWGGMHCFSLSSQATPQWLDATFTWLDANLDPRTGWWRRGVPHADRHAPLGGGVHIMPIYQHHNRRFPYPQQLIDSVLAMQLPEGRWHIHHTLATYLEMDALYALACAGELAPGYRSADILSAAHRFGALLTRSWPALRQEVFTTMHPHMSLAVAGAFGLLQRLLPQEFFDSGGNGWTDIFSAPALYRVRETEPPAAGSPPATTHRPARAGEPSAR